MKSEETRPESRKENSSERQEAEKLTEEELSQVTGGDWYQQIPGTAPKPVGSRR